MTDGWFDKYTYQVVAPRKYIPAKYLDAFDNQTPISLPAWDPMGALA